MAAIDDVHINFIQNYAFVQNTSAKAIRIEVTIDSDPNPGNYPISNQIHILPGWGSVGLGPTDNQEIGPHRDLTYEITNAEYAPEYDPPHP